MDKYFIEKVKNLKVSYQRYIYIQHIYVCVYTRTIQFVLQFSSEPESDLAD